MKKIVLELAKIVLFFIILWWVIVHITYILRNDTDEKENLMGFYAEEKNSLDAVFIGSSTMWASLNPLVMYNERGFTSYNIATSAQRPSSLKYLIKEAQKYQSDALYVIDVSNFVYDQSVWEEQNEGSLRRVTDGLKYSWNRFLCNYEQIKGKSNKISYYFDIIKYHSEYRNFFHNISHWNFEKENTSKGWLYNDSVEAVSYTWNQNFGDHLPWQGDGNIFYKEMGLDFSVASDELIRKQYTEEYLIWANDAAKKLLNNDFLGEGPTISPCYLMNYLFEECGWKGNEYMQKMTYEMKKFPVISSDYLNIYKIDNEFVHDVPEKYLNEFNEIMSIQYYWRNHFLYKEYIENMNRPQNYIEEIKVKVDNIENDEITFINNTASSQSLVYAWYVNEKKGEDYECIYSQWYTTENNFKYQFSQDKEYSITAFVKGSENENLFKYKQVGVINYDHKKNKWIIKIE